MNAMQTSCVADQEKIYKSRQKGGESTHAFCACFLLKAKRLEIGHTTSIPDRDTRAH